MKQKYGLFLLQPDVHYPLQNTEGVWMIDRVLTFKKGVFKMRRFPKACPDCSYTVRLTEDGTKGFLIGSQGEGLYEFDPNAKDLKYKIVETVPKAAFVGLRLYESLGLMAIVHNEGIYIVDLKTLKLKSQLKKYAGNYPLLERGLNYYTDISPDKSKLVLYGGLGEEKSEFVYCYELASKHLIWAYKKKFKFVGIIGFRVIVLYGQKVGAHQKTERQRSIVEASMA